MRNHLSGLVVSLLAIPLTNLCLAAEAQWPYNLPPNSRYYPEDEALVGRNLEAQKKLEIDSPNGVRKMSGDASEMFFPEYWSFGQELGMNAALDRRRADEAEERKQNDWQQNTSTISSPQLPLLLHNSSPNPRVLLPRRLSPKLAARDFSCPSGTSSCANIGRSNSCCANGLSCNIITDTGLGDVGCCAAGTSCSGQVVGCQADYTSCPGQGGGCCIPGFQCSGVGCILATTATVTIQPLVVITSRTVIIPSPPSTTTQHTTSTSSATSTTIVTTIVSTTPAAIPIPAPTTCGVDFQSCPASIGGGCCPTDRICAASGLCPPAHTSTSSAMMTSAPLPPVRPTDSNPATTTLPASPSACPTGFYQCSAYYAGAACCQVGHDCASSSCPLRTSVTVLASQGVTVVVQPTVGVCANGWATCGADVGGGCCPSGWGCGTASCSAGVSGTATGAVGTMIAKGTASSARGELKWWVWSCLAMIWGLMVF